MSDQPSNQPGYRPGYKPGYQRHPLDIGPLVFGLVFLGIVAAWGLFEAGVVTGADTAWILPIVLIGAGALGVLLALTKPRRTEARQEARQAAADAYVARWAPAGYPEQTGTYAGTGDSYTGEAGTYTGFPVEHADDTLEHTGSTTGLPADETDTYADTDTYPGTYPGSDPDSDPGIDTDIYTDTSTGHNVETDNPERRDD